jgi:hypothetical protein
MVTTPLNGLSNRIQSQLQASDKKALHAETRRWPSGGTIFGVTIDAAFPSARERAPKTPSGCLHGITFGAGDGVTSPRLCGSA